MLGGGADNIEHSAWVLPLAQVAAFQCLVFVCLGLALNSIRNKETKTVPESIFSLKHFAIATALGFSFDLGAGKAAGVFTYPPAIVNGEIFPGSLWFLFCNAILSYATFSFTLGHLKISRNHRCGFAQKNEPFAILILSLCGIILFDNEYILIFSYGLLLISIVETLAMVLGISTPLAGSWKNPKPFLSIGISCSFIGLIYEIINLKFGLWKWTFLSGADENFQIVLIVLFGYFVLSYPFIVFALPRSANE